MNGVHYLVNFNGKLVSPHVVPEYWQNVGRYFISRHEILFRSKFLSKFFENLPISSIYLWSESRNGYVEINMYALSDYRDGNISRLICDVDNFGAIEWRAHIDLLNINRLSNWNEIIPNKEALNNLYLESKQYFIGVNYNIG